MMRSLWRHFWRLWRTVKRHPQGDWALASFYAFFPESWTRCANASGDRLLLQKVMPIVIRKHYVARDRRHRLYPDEYTRQLAKTVARKCCETGMEVTPDEAAEVRFKVLTLARHHPATFGMTDDEILRSLKVARDSEEL